MQDPAGGSSVLMVSTSFRIVSFVGERGGLERLVRRRTDGIDDGIVLELLQRYPELVLGEGFLIDELV